MYTRTHTHMHTHIQKCNERGSRLNVLRDGGIYTDVYYVILYARAYTHSSATGGLQKKRRRKAGTHVRIRENGIKKTKRIEGQL